MGQFGWLEIHVVDHCNNNCRWCHNYAPFSQKKEYEARAYFDGLDVLRKNKVNYQSISLMGGEPFLHSDLCKFAYEIFERYQKPLMITTNGFWLSEEAIKSYKDLWKIISSIRVSRYPTIEKRLGGADELKRLSLFIRKINPNTYVDIPDKAIFNKLEFHENPLEVEVYCGNSQCTALLPDMRMGRCGAGAYAHLAPEAHLSEAFKNSRHMFYDLRHYDLHSFMLWRQRYPLDACNYCGFSQKLRKVSWKVERGCPPFNKNYELEHDFILGKRMLALDDTCNAQKMSDMMHTRYGGQPEPYILEGLVAIQDGDLPSALESLSQALELNPENQEAMRYLHLVHHSVMRAHEGQAKRETIPTPS